MKKRSRSVADRETAMGDVFEVYRNAKGMWCSAVRYKDGRGTRVCCTGSPLVWVARDVYFNIVQAAQTDALDGKNPYVSAEYARSYKMR